MGKPMMKTNIQQRRVQHGELQWFRGQRIREGAAVAWVVWGFLADLTCMSVRMIGKGGADKDQVGSKPSHEHELPIDQAAQSDIRWWSGLEETADL